MVVAATAWVSHHDTRYGREGRTRRTAHLRERRRPHAHRAHSPVYCVFCSACQGVVLAHRTVLGFIAQSTSSETGSAPASAVSVLPRCNCVLSFHVAYMECRVYCDSACAMHRQNSRPHYCRALPQQQREDYRWFAMVGVRCASRSASAACAASVTELCAEPINIWMVDSVSNQTHPADRTCVRAASAWMGRTTQRRAVRGVYCFETDGGRNTYHRRRSWRREDQAHAPRHTPPRGTRGHRPG